MPLMSIISINWILQHHHCNVLCLLDLSSWMARAPIIQIDSILVQERFFLSIIYMKLTDKWTSKPNFLILKNCLSFCCSNTLFSKKNTFVTYHNTAFLVNYNRSLFCSVLSVISYYSITDGNMQNRVKLPLSLTKYVVWQVIKVFY